MHPSSTSSKAATSRQRLSPDNPFVRTNLSGVFCISEQTLHIQPQDSLEPGSSTQSLLEPGLKHFGLFEDQWQYHPIGSDAEAANFLTVLDSFLGRAPLPRTQAFKVAYTEALTNALYHAQGRKKGSSSTCPLPSIIHCELGFDDQYLYGSIRDTQGQLTAESITQAIEAAQGHDTICPETLESTTGGRGLFLIATLIQDVQIIISPGRATEIRLKQPRHISSLRLGGQCLEIITVESSEAV